MKRVLFYVLFAIGMTVSAQRVTFDNRQISINGDDMPWLLHTDGSQYEWVTDKYQWGNTYYDADGDIAVKTERRQEGDDLDLYAVQRQLSRCQDMHDLTLQCTHLAWWQGSIRKCHEDEWCWPEPWTDGDGRRNN